MKKKAKSVKVKTSPARSIRFSPDPLTVALLSTKNETPFNPTIVALVLNESYSGCSILICHDSALKKNQEIEIKVGHLAAMSAQVIWIKNFEESIYKVGLKFLE